MLIFILGFCHVSSSSGSFSLFPLPPCYYRMFVAQSDRYISVVRRGEGSNDQLEAKTQIIKFGVDQSISLPSNPTWQVNQDIHPSVDWPMRQLCRGQPHILIDVWSLRRIAGVCRHRHTNPYLTVAI